jgi:hypothetical protein
MVAVFVDESGQFTASTPISAVGALSLPHRCLARARRELNDKTADWPRDKGELKGGQLSTAYVVVLVDILFRHQAILHCTVTNVGPATEADIETHRLKQCEMMTRHLTSEHHPTLVAEVRELRQVLERMSNQLYLQSVAQTHLLCSVIEDIPNYFCQRRPTELGLFEWFVDAKDKNVTSQEVWWHKTLGPMIQSRSLKQPFGRIDGKGFNYKYFDKAYDIKKDTVSPETDPATDVGELVMKNLHFIDSKSDILVQATDVLVRNIRRVLTDAEVDLQLVESLGRLQINQKQSGKLQSLKFITLSNNAPNMNHLADISTHMTRAGRTMIVPGLWDGIKES